MKWHLHKTVCKLNSVHLSINKWSVFQLFHYRILTNLAFNHKQKTFSLSLVGFNDASNTTRLYKRPCKGCVQIAVLSRNHKTTSAALCRLLTQTKEAPKKRNRNCQSDKHIKRKSGKG